jgi:hypothetical protein
MACMPQVHYKPAGPMDCPHRSPFCMLMLKAGPLRSCPRSFYIVLRLLRKLRRGFGLYEGYFCWRRKIRSMSTGSQHICFLAKSIDRLTCSSSEKGWQLLKSSLARRRFRKLAQEFVKLFDSPVSNAFGTSKSVSATSGSVSMDRFDGRNNNALVASSSLCMGGINSGAIGGGLRSRYSDDPVQARSSCTSSAGRSPCASAADTGAARELHDRKATSNESNARMWKPVRGDTRRYKETPRQRFSCRLFRVGRGWWCDTRAASDSLFAKH